MYKRVAFHTLGCKLNFSETSTIGREFINHGYDKVNFEEVAEVYVINTCSVTHNADKECRQIVRAVMKRSPHAFIAVIGCYAQLKPDEIAKIEGVDLVLGASEKFKLTDYLKDIKKKESTEIHACAIEDVNFFENSYSAGDRTRAFLKVQDGCDYNCTFCTIPMARGKSRSDSIENILNSVKEIAEKGIKEIVLTGVNIGDFGIDPETGERKETFLQLIQALDQLSAIHRFRISSIEPNLLSDEIIEFVAQSERFVPHFHIPLQAGSNELLKSMRRRYKKELYAERVSKIKTLMPHACIGVDVIIGFPGESEEAFLSTFKFLNELDISYLHVFTYSKRSNTIAAEMQEQVSTANKKKRHQQLRILSDKKLRHFYTQHLNTEKEILVEGKNKDGYMHGFSANYVKVKLPYDESLINTLITVDLDKIDTDGLVEAKILITENH